MRPDRIPLHDGTLDLREGVVERSGERIKLTTREVELLRYLAERPEAAVPRETLLLDVWDYAPGVESRTVDTTVKRLRKKLETDPSQPRHLISVHGVGYRLLAAPAAAAPVPDDPDGFVGREAELAEIVAALQSEARLVTLRGPGGVGKSRLAREVLRLRAEAGDAVLPADLSDCRSADDIRAEIGSALGLPPTADARDVMEALAARVPALVFFDQADGCLDALRGLLPEFAESRGATCLITAREALRLANERAVRLDPMPAGDAAALFRLRAGLSGDPESLAELVDALDGLPLAIELAAARAAVLSPSEILARLDQRFRLLSERGSGRRLRDTIAWSWEGLEPDERTALAALSIFAGGFELAAAESVLTPLVDDWVLDLVDVLEARSLLQRREEDGRSRFGMLQSVRTFVREEAEPELLGAAAERHRAWAVARAKELGQAVDGSQAGKAIRGLLAERPNLRAAWEGAPPGPDRAALAWMLARLHEHAGSAQVGLEIVQSTLDEPGEISADDRGRLHLARGLLRRGLSHLADARADAELAFAAARVDTPALLADSAVLLSYLDDDEGYTAASNERLAGVLAALPESSPERLRVLHRHGQALFHQGRIPEAEEAAQELFAQARGTGQLLSEGSARRLISALRLRGSRFDEAWTQATTARTLFADAGDALREGVCLELMGVVRAFEGRHADGARCHREAVAIYRRMGHRNLLPRALANLARTLLHGGQEAEARTVAEDAIAQAHERGALRQELEGRTLAGTIALAEGRHADAAALYRQAVQEAEQANLPLVSGMARACLAIGLLVSGDLDEARRANDAAIEAYEGARDLLGAAHHWATRTAIEARAGDLDAAERAYARCEETAPAGRGRPEPWMRVCYGFVLLARGDRAALQEVLDHTPADAFGRTLLRTLIADAAR